MLFSETGNYKITTWPTTQPIPWYFFVISKDDGENNSWSLWRIAGGAPPQQFDYDGWMKYVVAILRSATMLVRFWHRIL